MLLGAVAAQQEECISRVVALEDRTSLEMEREKDHRLDEFREERHRVMEA